MCKTDPSTRRLGLLVGAPLDAARRENKLCSMSNTDTSLLGVVVTAIATAFLGLRPVLDAYPSLHDIICTSVVGASKISGDSFCQMHPAGAILLDIFIAPFVAAFLHPC